MKNLLSPDSDWHTRSEKTILCLATGFYSSLLPPKIAVKVKQTSWGRRCLKESWTGSGISGAVLGILTYLVLPRVAAVSIWSLLAGIIFAVYISHRAEKLLGVHDDPRIVIDEWIGCWMAMVGLPPLLSLPHHFGFEVVIAFILFRIFDVYKGPWGRQLQNLPGGWGVVMDDVAAGFIANIFARVVIVCIGVL